MQSSGRRKGYRLKLPSLIKHLRSILDQYPDDGQILKELIQNAEDAGATEVKFLYDENEYPTRYLHDPSMAQFQGAAFYAYNNATFVDEDWDGLLLVQDSYKEKDPMKVGRFGLGFKSVLHMTDLPSVLSKGQLLMIDPQEKFLHFEGKLTSARMWELSDKEELAQCPDQFKPYVGIFGSCKETFEKCFYNGTLFRFPLRNNESELSNTIYDSSRIQALIESFEHDAETLLLFLKNIEKIELYHRPKGKSQPVKLYEVRLAENCSSQVKKNRQDFKRRCKYLADLPPEGYSATYQLTLQVHIYKDGVPVTQTSTSWLVTDHVAGNDVSTQLLELCKDDKLSLVPLVGVAMQLNTQKQAFDGPPDPRGQIFCFLPLPVEQQTTTGFPVHVNGYFAISQNRRHLKWPSASQKIEGDKSVLWNQCVLRELVPKAYIEMLLQAVKLSSDFPDFIRPIDVYNAMPNPQNVDEKWKVVMEKTLQKFLRKAIIHSEVSGGKWVGVTDALFDCLEEDKNTRHLISEVLLKCGKNVARVPQHLFQALQSYFWPHIQIITPGNTRKELQRCSHSYKDYSLRDRLLLLQFLLKDKAFHEMIGLELLPRGDGVMVPFSKYGEIVYIPTLEIPRDLFPGLDNCLVAEHLGQMVFGLLQEMALKNICQLRVITLKDAEMLIQRILPSNWRTQAVVDTRYTHLQIPKEWFTVLWKFLQWKYLQNLEPFRDMHIIPLGKNFHGKLITLSNPCVISSYWGFEMSSSEIVLLETLGIHVIKELPQCIKNHNSVIGDYVKIPRNKELIALICQCFKSDGRDRFLNKVVSLTRDAKMALVEMIGNATDHLTNTQIQVLSDLPILPSTHSSTGDCDYVSAAMVRKGVDSSSLPCKLEEKMVEVSRPEVRKAAQSLGIGVLEKRELMMSIIYEMKNKKYDRSKMDKFINFIFMKIKKFCGDHEIMSLLGDIPFVTCGGKDWKKPCELYDPSDVCMRAMFFGQKDMFPTGKFAQPERMTYLKMMGLKCITTYTADDALNAMKHIQRQSKLVDISEKATALVSILNDRPELLCKEINTKTLQSYAKTIAWVPVMQVKPPGYPKSLSWHGEHLDTVAKADDIVDSKYASTVGSVYGIVGQDVSGFAEAFGWNEKPSVSKILDHLNNTVQVFNAGQHDQSPQEKASYLQMVSAIYSELQTRGATDVLKALERKNMDRWVWHGEGFTMIDCIFEKQHQLYLSPHIFTLPPEMKAYLDFFRQCGLQKSCDSSRLIGVLEQINRAKDQNPDKCSLFVHQTIDILNTVKYYYESLSPEIKSRILLPVGKTDSFSMKNIEDCCYCDEEWFRHDLKIYQNEVNLIHEDLPMDTAQKLHVPSIISKIIPTEDIVITGFGQDEQLTCRLKNILKDYSDGLAVFKEMIQNADDAGATEIHFLYDERMNIDHRERLLDPAMSSCQGPALWVYNNATFSNKDFENIIKLGGATKESEPDKIGRFGLGFNVVYNLTDVPSFVSKNFIVMFDPHKSYLGKFLTKQNQPGIKIDMNVESNMLNSLRDQFKPYQCLFGCEISKNKSYNGTLFRLPLRTRQQAVSSEISQLHYSKGEMIDLIQLLFQHAHSLLLFTQHVQKMAFHHLPPDADARDIKELFWLSKGVCLYIGDGHNGQLTGQKSLLSMMTKKMQCAEGPLSCTAHVKTTVRVNDTPQLDILLPQNEETVNWLIASKAEHSNGTRGENQAAVGSVAMMLTEANGGFLPKPIETTSKALVYCFLPLPIETGLRVHINGTFEMSSSRRHLAEHTMDDKDKSKAEWNRYVLTAIVYKAYIQGLQDIKDILPSDVDANLHDIWPTADVIKSVRPLVETFYGTASFQDLPFCSTDNEIITLQKIIFFDTKNIESDIAEDALSLFRDFKEQNHIVEAQNEVLETLKSFGHTDFVDSRLYNITDFFEKIFFPNIDFIDARDRNKLVIYAICMNDKDIDKLLTSNACIPTTNDSTELKHISKLVDPRGRTAKLYSKEDNRFPHKEIQTDAVMERLVLLGMQSDEISWEELVERAKSVEIYYNKNRKMGLKRMELVVQYIEHNLTVPSVSDDLLENAKTELRAVKFLACGKEPIHYPPMWKYDAGKKKSLYCPSELYHCSVANLVSASEPIADESYPPKVSEFLNFKKDIQKTQITGQLTCLKKQNMLALSSESYEVCEKIMHDIYKYVQDKEDDSWIKDFKDTPSILVEKQFIEPTKTFLNLEKDYKPYLYRLPEELKTRCEQFLFRIGVPKNYDIQTLIKVLHQVHTDVGSSSLTHDNLKMVVDIVMMLSDKMHKEKVKLKDVEDKYGSVYIPNDAAILCPSSSLCFNNCPWVQKAGMNFVHKDLPYSKISNLGIKTKKEKAMDVNSIGIPFGQKQNLTKSISKILNNCDRFDVLKEMIQNADDAGATEIHFIRDSMVHGKQYLFDDSWVPLQGPALCVYNNKPFTERDLEGIQRMGEGSKQLDPCATGQFGVGFCSVYHLTDVPSVLTTSPEKGKTLCVFDPQCKYVPGATSAEPGRRIDCTEEIIKSFKDVFSCYHEDKFDIESGCMFRLPLRTDQMRKDSDLCDQMVSMDDIYQMFVQLQTECSEILLFLNNIEKNNTI